MLPKTGQLMALEMGNCKHCISFNNLFADAHGAEKLTIYSNIYRRMTSEAVAHHKWGVDDSIGKAIFNGACQC